MKKLFLCELCTMVLMVACTGGKQATYVGVGLTPYGSTTNAEAQTLAPITTGTPLPTPSPTPHYHVVAAGETMSSIAVLYGFNMKDVVDANPDINPNAMVVGMQVLIPAKPASTQEVPIAADLEPITLDDPQCYQEKSGGLWCFLTAVNENANAVENVLVEITIGDANASQLSARIAAAPLNMIPAGGEQVLSAYFPPPIPDPFRYSYQLVSSIPVEDMSRYIETKILEQSIDISNDGLTAQVSARVFMNGIVGDTVRVWLSAIAKDANGAVMGVRRIEAVTELDSLGIVEVTGFVYSVESPIEEVALQAEAIYTQ